VAFLLSPVGNESQIDSNGAPLSGGLIETYLAGTSSVSPTFTNNTGTVAQTNPIILNTLGLPPQPIWLSDVVSYKFIFKSSTGIVMRTIDNIMGVPGAAASLDQWVLFVGTPTFINATTFSVLGDQTGIFTVNRRTKSVMPGGLVYSSVVSSTFTGGITTVVLVNDPGIPGVLKAGLSQVFYGILTSTSGALPADVARVSYLTFTGVTDTATGGTPPNYTVTLDPSITSYVHGQRFRIRFHAANQGPPPMDATLNINGLGPKFLAGKGVNGGLFAPAIQAGLSQDVQYDAGTDRLLILNPIDGSNMVGELFWWMHPSIPPYALLCNGAAVSRQIYVRLYNVVSTFYGPGDGSTTFNIPGVTFERALLSTNGGLEGSATPGNIIQHNHVLRTVAVANVGSTRRTVDPAGDTSQATDQTGNTTGNIAYGIYSRLCIRF
jgi:microcystin-dependent protein